ncbi:MAG: hypothetical protein J7L23_01160 [Candidatus Diapherotrites archaeon]|nr:hypothetical protein [Candidatus Diapherotrites archaeon]
MNSDEIYYILMLGFVAAAVGYYYFPGLIPVVLPYVALLGAFYLIFGVLTRITGFTTGIGWSRKEDWINGFILLFFVGLIMGRPDLAVSSVKLCVNLVGVFVKWVFTLGL